MELPPIPPNVSVREVLPTLGFQEEWGTPTDREPAYVFRDTGIELHVAECLSKYFRPVFLLTGFVKNERSIKVIESEIPLFLESREQALALFAHFVDFDLPIDWVREGRALRQHLPWEQERSRREAEFQVHQRLRDARPHCFVRREWLRPILRKLRLLLEDAGSAAPMLSITFDGSILRVQAAGEFMAAPAEGPRPWPDDFQAPLAIAAQFPRRMDREMVEVGVWNGNLEFGRLIVSAEI